MKPVLSHSELISGISGKDKSFLLLYKPGSEQSDCALNNIIRAEIENPGLKFLSADVTRASDIHSVYGISTVPAILVFEGDKLTNIIKGCHESDYYKALASGVLRATESSTSGRNGKHVTVYSTPTCSWCNTLKTWLRNNNISFTDIDVSADYKAAEALVKRSGQQGVPQTDIDGRIVVGFNQPLLKELLEIQ